MIDKYFDMLEDWKLLPAYKLEPRIDSLVGYALQTASADLLDVQCKILIPELPIRLGTVHPQHVETHLENRSYKVDFYIRGQKGENVFIEFKTDSESIRDEQIGYLAEAEEVRMKAIVEGILKLHKATQHKQKYEHLLNKLSMGGLIDSKNQAQIADEEIRIVFVQPRIVDGGKQEDVFDFKELSKSIRQSFPEERLMMRLANSLELWAAD